MKVSSAAAASPSCALPGVRGAEPEAGRARGRALLEPAEQAAAAASLLYDMKGCYSRLRALVPTLPRHRRVSKVELLQHVIDYIWALQLELDLDLPPPAPRDPAEATCVSAADHILCR
ncbi:DNA-binding protein inhibitor ID-1 [Alligator mississippiensis]|nr:DNA-binding protein inhibitor ID-1 [Alligator mississippiensis]